MSITRVQTSSLGIGNPLVQILRDKITSDKNLYSRLSNIDDYETLLSALLDSVKEDNENDEYSGAAETVAAEIIELRKDPGTYLMFTSGQPAIKLTSDMLYQPPPVETENGIKVIAPKLHPRISSAITLAVHESSKLCALERTYKTLEPFKHLRDPWSIIEEASKLISDISIAHDESSCDKSIYIELGRENVNGIYQGFNPSFTRYKVFASSLARYIRDLNPSRYIITQLDRSSDSKYCWYDVTVKYAVVES